VDYRQALEQGFRDAPFVAHLGIELEALGPGWCEAGLAPGEFVVTAEYKINLLRGARGERLHCRAEVLKPGQTLVVVEASVHAVRGEERELVARLNATMAVVKPRAQTSGSSGAPAG